MDDQGFPDCQLTSRRDELRSQIKFGVESLLVLIAGETHESKQLENLTNKLVQTIDEFEASPKLLDEDLHVHFDQLLNAFYKVRVSSGHRLPNTGLYLQSISKIVYTFAKVRGFKYISQLFTTNIYKVPEIVELLEGYELINGVDDELFVSLLWISNLVLVPFPFDLVTAEMELLLLLISVRIYKVILRVLDHYDSMSKNLDIATVIMSRLLSRLDQITLRFEFLNLKGRSNHLGYLMALNKLVKRIRWSEENGLVEITNCIWNVTINNTSDDMSFLLPYRVKLMGKLVQLYSTQKDYTNITNVINALHDIAETPSTINYDLKYTIAKTMYIAYNLISQVAVNYADQYLEYVWNQMFLNPKEDLGQYHIGLLFYGYIFLNGLGRNSLDITFKLISLVGINLYPENDSHNKLGTNIREATLFCYYGFVRELGGKKRKDLLYHDDQLTIINSVFYNLLKLVMFDSEIYIRRCALAVVQEYLGRLGLLLDESNEFQLKAMELLATQGILRQNLELIQSTIEEFVKLGVPVKFFLLILIEKMLEPSCPNLERRRKVLHWYITTKSTTNNINKLPLAALADYPILFDENHLISSLSSENSLLDLDTRLMILVGIGQWENSLVLQFKKEFVFNPSRDSILKGENRLKIHDHDHDHDVSSLIPIFKAVNIREYDVGVFIQFMETAPLWQWSYILSLIPHHKILAQCILWHPQCPWDVCLLVEDASVHYTIRTLLIQGVSTTWDKVLRPWDTYKKVGCAIRWLDDYTMTNQGDVGSHLRRASMKLIESKLSEFYNSDHEILPRLVRMMGEGIDGVRKQAMQLAISFLKMKEPERYLIEELNDYSSYFRWYFNGYSELWYSWRKDFWKGLVTTLGSTVGSRILINGCFNEFYLFYIKADSRTRGDVIDDIIDLMILDVINKPNLTKSEWNKHTKIVSLAVRVILRMMESGLIKSLLLLPEDELKHKLYVRCYNLTLSKTCDDRMISIIKILHLMGDDVARKRVLVLIKRHNLELLQQELDFY